MSRINGSVLLVGSVPGANSEEVMRLCARELGDRIALLPDGETGYRRVWINFLAARFYDTCTALDTLNRPEPVDPADESEWREAGDDWIPKGYHNHWQFKVRSGESVCFDHLGYAKEAAASYEVFKKLRAEGVVSKDQRFMVTIPLDTPSGEKGCNRLSLPK